MWFWPLSEPKKLSVHQLLWWRLFAVVAFAHCMLLFILLFVYRGYAQLHVDANGISLALAEVMVMPLQKVVAKNVSKPQKSNEQKVAQHVAHKEQEQQVLRPVVPKQKPTTGVQPQKKQEKRKNAQHKKQQEKKVEHKKEATSEPVKEIEQKPQAEPVSQEQSQPVAQESQPEQVMVGRDELEALVVQQEIQREIEQRWHPPQGLAADAACHVHALVDWQGKVQEVKIEKSSGILVFDVHARCVAQSIPFPKAVWGKEIILHFNNRA